MIWKKQEHKYICDVFIIKRFGKSCWELYEFDGLCGSHNIIRRYKSMGVYPTLKQAKAAAEKHVNQSRLTSPSSADE